MKKVTSLFSLFAVITLTIFSSCRTTTNPNEWVISTGTCWNTMTVSKAGDVIPRSITACDRVIVLPATSLEMKFTTDTKFAGRVSGAVELTGQWRISDPILFIQNAKSITSAATGEDHKIDVNALEEIENGVVDKMLIDLIREYTPDKEAGIDELDVEKDLGKLAAGKFASRGVEFFNMSINITFTPQTEGALDAISALKFYKANGEEDFGRQVILNKALAPNISVNVTNQLPSKED